MEKGAAYSLLEVNHGAGYLNAICRGRPQELLDIIALIEEEVDTLKDWFGVNFTRVNSTSLPCLCFLCSESTYMVGR